MLTYEVLTSDAFHKDLKVIGRHLFKSYRDILKESPAKAADRVVARLEEANAYVRTFQNNPHRGTEHPQIRAGLRSVTHRDFIYIFMVDDEKLHVRVLATFFGGEDHHRKFADRIRS